MRPILTYETSLCQNTCLPCEAPARDTICVRVYVRNETGGRVGRGILRLTRPEPPEGGEEHRQGLGEASPQTNRQQTQCTSCAVSTFFGGLRGEGGLSLFGPDVGDARIVSILNVCCSCAPDLLSISLGSWLRMHAFLKALRPVKGNATNM